MTQHRMLSNPMGLAVLDTCRMAEPGRLLITRLRVPDPHQRKGIGSELLQQECNLADATGTTLVLDAVPYDDSRMTKDQLIAFYQKFGFRVDHEGGMIRSPQP